MPQGVVSGVVAVQAGPTATIDIPYADPTDSLITKLVAVSGVEFNGVLVKLGVQDVPLVGTVQPYRLYVTPAVELDVHVKLTERD